MPSPYPVDPAQIDALINDLSHLLSNARDFTSSGREIRNPSTSMARMPLVNLEQLPGGGAARGAFASSTLGTPGMSELMSPTVSQAERELGKARIDKLLGNISLDLPKDLPPLPEGMSNWDRFKQAARMPVGLMTFIDLMTHSPELNQNEQEMLAARRLLPPTIDR